MKTLRLIFVIACGLGFASESQEGRNVDPSLSKNYIKLNGHAPPVGPVLVKTTMLA